MNCPHCKTPLAEHEATRCMDAWIAESVFGWTPDYEYMDGEIPNFNKSKFGETGTSWDKAHHWSVLIADAWEVVEKLRKKQVLLPIWSLALLGDFPLQVCRAALQAVISEKEGG